MLSIYLHVGKVSIRGVLIHSINCMRHSCTRINETIIFYVRERPCCAKVITLRQVQIGICAAYQCSETLWY